MIIDGVQVTALMRARHLDAYDVARRMRRRGLPGTTAQWVRMAMQGRWGDCPVSWAGVLAGVLGCQPVEICASPVLALVRDESHDLQR